jgi:hypothetical protein
MDQWVISLSSFVVGTLLGSLGAVYVFRADLREMKTILLDVRDWIKTLRDRTHGHNDAILIHDGEIDEIMRRLDMNRTPRRRRDKR